MTSQAPKLKPDNLSNFKKEDTQDTIDQHADIREGLEALKEDVAALTKIMAKSSMEELGRVKDTMKESSKELWEQTAEFSKKNLKPAEEGIKNRPFIAVGAAFGLGFLASVLLKRAS